MKYFSKITTFVLTLSFVMTLGVFPVKSAFCSGPDCTADLGGTMEVRVVPIDENGDVIAGTPVTYNWVVNPGALGTITSQGQTGTNITVSNSSGVSDAVFTSDYGADTGSTGKIYVDVTYGGVGPLRKTWNLSVFCNSDPTLYYAIGSVKDSDDNNWHKSTAEIMETCYTEYKLYGGMGERY